MGPNDNLIKVLVGNKFDLGKHGHLICLVDALVSAEEAQQYADQHQLLFFQVSAKSGDYITHLFDQLGNASPKLGKGDIHARPVIS